MRSFIIICMFLSFTSCSKKKTDKEIATFGEKFEATNITSREDLLKKYETLKAGDSIDVIFQSDVKGVCKKKGCWMSLELKDQTNTFVKFRDYAFFVPLDADSLGVATVKGKAFVYEYSIQDQKEYMKDAGKTKEEIDAITKPKRQYSFLADGVQMYRK